MAGKNTCAWMRMGVTWLWLCSEADEEKRGRHQKGGTFYKLNEIAMQHSYQRKFIRSTYININIIMWATRPAPSVRILYW